MRKVFLLLAGIAMMSLPATLVYGQDNCKVLLPKIADFYKGSCKQGLADGQGEASGIDQYKGDFKKGLPEGPGTYIWQSGDKYEGQWKKGLRDGNGIFTVKYKGRDSVLAGVWKEDIFLGKEVLPPYAITYRNSIGRVSCMKIADKPYYVRYKFSRSGESSVASISGLIMTGSSGSESSTGSVTGFESVTFPFEGKVKFSAPNAFATALMNCEVRLTVNQPGAWVITIFY